MWALFTSVAAGSVVARVLLALGVGFVTYVGFSSLITMASSQIEGQITGLPSDALNMMGLAGVDYLINIVFSAYSARVALMAVSSFKVSK